MMPPDDDYLFLQPLDYAPHPDSPELNQSDYAPYQGLMADVGMPPVDPAELDPLVGHVWLPQEGGSAAEDEIERAIDQVKQIHEIEQAIHQLRTSGSADDAYPDGAADFLQELPSADPVDEGSGITAESWDLPSSLEELTEDAESPEAPNETILGAQGATLDALLAGDGWRPLESEWLAQGVASSEAEAGADEHALDAVVDHFAPEGSVAVPHGSSVPPQSIDDFADGCALQGLGPSYSARDLLTADPTVHAHETIDQQMQAFDPTMPPDPPEPAPPQLYDDQIWQLFTPYRMFEPMD